MNPLNPNTTLAQEWEQYFKMMYGGKGIAENQEAETRQAFFSGASVAITLFSLIAEQIESEEEAAKKMRALGQEAFDVLDLRVNQLEQGRN